MNRFNFNIKDRKLLYIVLCVVLVLVFTLTIAYAALNVVLNISGSAEVVASNWDIHLSNPSVTKGSVNNDVPTISGNTLSFSTVLTKPGDFYEFTVDVVNSGSIDAMISSVTKKPDLTEEQAKYLKYEITYQNGESITTKQLLSSNSSMPIRVKIEYRKDLVASDLPTTNTALDMSIELNYIQSDGSASGVLNDGASIAVAYGDLNEVGTIVEIGNEKFYVFGTEGNNVKLLSMYNLYVGGRFESESEVYTAYGDEATGMQDSTMRGYASGDIHNGVTAFSNTSSTYEGSIVEGYVNNYKTKLELLGVPIEEARLITYEELIDNVGCAPSMDECDATQNSWIIYTSFWTQTAKSDTKVMYVEVDGGIYDISYDVFYSGGVRPVIIVSKDVFGFADKYINFYNDVSGYMKMYHAEIGSSFSSWINSTYNSGKFKLFNVCGRNVVKIGYSSYLSKNGKVVYGDDIIENINYQSVYVEEFDCNNWNY